MNAQQPSSPQPAAPRHPDLERWVAYRDGEAAPDEVEELRQHLVECPQCVPLLLDLEAFAEPSPGDRGAVSEIEMAAAWRSFRSALARQRRGRRRPAAQGWWPWLAVAASLALAVFGLGSWATARHDLGELRGRIAALSQPQPQPQPQKNVPVLDLFRRNATRGETPEPAAVIRRSTFTTLVLSVSDARAFDDYQVEIVGAADQVVWSGGGFELNQDLGTLTLGLPASFLPPDEYRLRLYGMVEGRRELLEGYPPFRIGAD